MSDHLPRYDQWKTNAPEFEWGVCPDCGASQEDAEQHGESYLCRCGTSYSNDQAHPDARDDEPVLPGDE
jgi:tRNA(Ile2) C34 agmatinyltransferase TiaS